MRKETDLWVHNLPRLVNFLGTEDDPKFICHDDCSQVQREGRHESVRGNSKLYTPFPDKLVSSWQTIVDASLAEQRRTTLSAPADIAGTTVETSNV